MPAQDASPANKRQRVDPLQAAPQHPPNDGFVVDNDAAESGGDDDDDDGEKPKSDKKAGRRKIKIEFIQDKSRRHITFSKRKAGIMKKAYELSTLTGTQVLLLVVSETGLVYTFTTAKLQPLVTQPEGKNLIQACLNAPHGTLPSTMPVGQPLGRSNPMSIPPAHHAPPPGAPGAPGAPNVPGGLAIGASGKDDAEEGEQDDADGGEHPRKRRRASSSTGAGQAPQSAQARNGPSPTTAPAPPSTSPHQRTQPMPALAGAGAPPALAIPQQPLQGGMDHSPRQGQPGAQPTSPNYTHTSPGGAYGAPAGDPGMYAQGHAGYPPAGYTYDANAGHAAQQWGAPVQQGNHYGTRR